MSTISRYRCACRSPTLADGDVQDVSDDESDESSEEDENDDEDSETSGKREVKEEFNLGRFCAARTRVYHQFSHWEVRPIMQDPCT